MDKKRRGEPEEKLRFRSERMIQREGKWFFYTREGTIEGPFETERAAMNRLETYAKLMRTGLVSSDEDFIKSWTKSMKSKDPKPDW